MMRVEWVDGREAFGSLAAAWAPLTAGADHPFSDHDWLEAWIDAFAPTARLRTVLAWRGDELAAGLPLLHHGRRLSCPANYHSPMFDIPCTGAAARAAVIAEALGAPAGDLRVHGLEAGGAALTALRGGAVESRRPVLEEPAHVSPVVETDGDAEAWSRARGSTLRRRRRKLERDHGARLRLDADPGSLPEGFRLEGSGWKLDRGTAIVSRPETVAFYTTLARRYAARGELVLGWLDVDGVPAAFHFSLRRAGRLFMLKTGYDEAVRSLAPGIVLHLLTVERCFAGEERAYELLGDAERWKLDLATTVRPHSRLWIHRRRPVPFMRYAIRRWARPAARRVRDRLTRSA